MHFFCPEDQKTRGNGAGTSSWEGMMGVCGNSLPLKNIIIILGDTGFELRV
jgi:hypothetical protein